MRVETLSTLDGASERLLRERALLHGRDPAESLTQLRAALRAGRLCAVRLHDDDGTARGIAAWRWQDDAQTYAQVLLLYLQPVAAPVLGEALADYVFSELLRARDLAVIEARVRDQSPGIWETWGRRGAILFERCRMIVPLGHLPVPILPVPQPYRIVPWRDEHQAAAEKLAVAAYADSIDAVVVPAFQGERIASGLHTLRSATHGGADRWCDGACFVALDRQEAVVGYVAVAARDGSATVSGLAVDPAHRRRGLARLLLVRSMGVCLREGFTTLTAAVTTRNPVRQLVTQVGFQATACGQVAIWWRDGRHVPWGE